MDESLSHWLGLREPADAMARSEALTRTIAGAVPASEPVCVLDLATGTGSNIRYLMDRLPGRQRWLAVDRDAALLAELSERMSSWGAAKSYTVRTEPGLCIIRGASLECDIETRQMDLGALEDREIFAGRHLVTASALFTISYNGRSSCDPAEPEDDIVRDLMNQHQRRDKGLGGPAAGPDAIACAERCFAEAGYSVQREPSDWTLGPDVAALQRMLIDGWAHAATEMLRDRPATIASWRARRLAHIDAGRSRLVVGHDDLAAWPPRAQGVPDQIRT